MKKGGWLARRMRGAWEYSRVICRLLAIFCWWSALSLLQGGDFKELSFGQQGNAFSLVLFLIVALNGIVHLTCLSVVCYPFHTDSCFLLGGATVCVWCWLVNAPTGVNGSLFWLAVFAVYSLFVLFFLQKNRVRLSRLRFSYRAAFLVVAAGAVISCVVISTITCLRYKTFSSPNFDFGLFVNMFHNMRESGLPMVTCERDHLLSHFAVHISPIYYLLLPFYAIFPSPMTLQIGQAVALLLGVIPVVLLAKHFGLSPKVTAVVGLLYAFYPALSTGCFYDLHENCFLPLFLLLTFYFFESRRPIPMYLSAVCVLMVKEDAAIYLLFFALYLLLSRRSYLHGGILAGVSVGWFALALSLLKIYGEGVMDYRYANLILDSSDGLLGAIKTAFANPGYLLTQLFTTSGGTWDKFLYVLQILLPLALLPFCTRRASRWLLCAPLLLNLLTNYIYQYDLGFQYHFGVTAFLFYATLLNLRSLPDRPRARALGIAVAATLTLYAFCVAPSFNGYIARWQEHKDTYRRMEEILDTIPEDASVNASTFLIAHIADRDEIYEITYHKNKPDVDYVVIDKRFSDWEASAKPYLDQGYTTVFSERGTVAILARTPIPSEGSIGGA